MKPLPEGRIKVFKLNDGLCICRFMIFLPEGGTDRFRVDLPEFLVPDCPIPACISLQVSPVNTNIAIPPVSEYTDILYCIETGERTIWMKKIPIAWKLLVTACSLWRLPCSF